jgi:hypothetical protein
MNFFFENDFADIPHVVLFHVFYLMEQFGKLFLQVGQIRLIGSIGHMRKITKKIDLNQDGV